MNINPNAGTFNVADGTLALALVAICKEAGLKIAANTCMENFLYRTHVISLQIEENELCLWSFSKEGGSPLFLTLKEAIAFITRKIVTPPVLPKIEEYTTSATYDGIKVGCTFVAWNTLDRIVSVTNTYRAQLADSGASK